jgi:hypothetical protein
MSAVRIDSGLGIVTAAEGGPGPAGQLAYTCTFVMPDGIFEGMHNIRPYGGRWADPILVTPLANGTIFPVYRSNQQFQACMPFEPPQFAPCGGQSLQGGSGWGNFLAALKAAPPIVRRTFAEMLKEHL